MSHASTLPMILAGISMLVAPCAATSRGADSYTFVYQDIEHFLGAFDRYREGADLEQTLRREYFESGTPGLVEFAERFRLSSEVLAESVTEHERFYASLHDLEARIRLQEPKMREAFEQLRQVHPDAAFPPFYFLVGGLRAGGQAGTHGLLIGAEVYSANTTNHTHLPPGRRVYPTERISHIVAHELAHFQQVQAQGIEVYRQIYGPEQSLLANAIREGSADFIAELISGDHINPAAHEYGCAHEAELWSEFRTQMREREFGDWFYHAPKDHADWPTDLGYFIGYRITRAFYENAADKRQAFQDILAVTDYEAFLERSGYPRQFASP